MMDECDSHAADLGRHAQRLIDLLPQLPRRLLVRQETKDQWERCLRTGSQLVERCQHGLLPVVALIGPSGAGKSTIFRLLTGIEVPAGSGKRPCTYNMVAAVPRGTSHEKLQWHFRHFDLQPLDRVDQLKHHGEPPNRLYFIEWTCRGHAPYCLVDTPDFSTYARENWEKAERMVERADVVLFVTTAEQYADEKSAHWLRTSACRAGFLIILLTKVDSEDAAKEIYEDLERVVNECVRPDTTENGPRLDDCRSHGMTTRQFLKQSWFYYSERSRTPRLEDVRGLCGDVAPLGEFFQGHSAQQIVFDKMARDVKLLCAMGQRIEQVIRQRSLELARWHSEIEGEVRKTKFLVRREGLQERHLIPHGRLLEIAIEVADRQSPYMGALRTKVRAAAGQFRAWMAGRMMKRYPVLGQGVRHVSKLKQYVPARGVDADAQDDWQTQERKRVCENAKLLIQRLSDGWERRWSAETQQDDLAHQLQGRLNKLLEGDWLPPEAHWETWVAGEYEQWFQEHPTRRELFLARRSVPLGVSIFALAADVVFTGGGMSLLVTGPLAGVHMTPDFESLLGERLASEWLRIREAQLAEWVLKEVVRPVLLQGLPSPLNHAEMHTLNEWNHLLKKMEDHLSAVLKSTGQTAT